MLLFGHHEIRSAADGLRLAKDERGVSAVEFAMMLPLMLTLYLRRRRGFAGRGHRPQGDA